jgi:basic amino acid/polyamine antiporter, APA family
MSIAATSPGTGQELRRQLGLGSATAAVAGEALGVGIFLTPASMAKALGSPFWLLLVWLAVGLMTICGAICYGELAGRFPRPGGSYVYLEQSFGPRVAFLYGWMCLLVLDPGLTAALATGSATYAAYILHWTPLEIKAAAVSVILLFCSINYLSTKGGAVLIRVMTWMKFLVLASLVGWAVWFHLGSWSNFSPFVAQRPGSLPLAPALGAALVGAFFSFGGWWDVSKLSGEVRDPGRTLPRAMILGICAVTAAYVLVNAVFLYLIPIERVGSDSGFVALVGEQLFGHAGGVVFSAIVIVCILSSMGAMMLAAPRVYYAMAQDGVFLQEVARPHPRFGTPSGAIIVQGVVASALVVLGTFDQIIAYFIFAAVFFLGLTVVGLFAVRRRSAAAGPGVLLAVGYPATPIAFLALVLLLLTLVAVRTPREVLLGCLVVLAGAPVYSVFKRRRDASASPSARG